MIFAEGHAVAEGELSPGHQLAAHCLLGQADVALLRGDLPAALTSYRAAADIFVRLLDLTAVSESVSRERCLSEYRARE